MAQIMSGYLTPIEAAALSGAAESTLRNKAAAGAIPGAVKKGKQWLLPVRTLKAMGLLDRSAPGGRSLANAITLTHEYNELVEHASWRVLVETPEGDSTSESYGTLDEALSYIRDVAERPLRPFDVKNLLQDR